MKKIIIIPTFCFCLLGQTAKASFPLDPWLMLNSFGQEIGYTQLQDFMSIYQDKFQNCQNTDAFLQAARLFKQEKHNDDALAVLKQLSLCKNLPKSTRLEVLKEEYFLTPETRRIEIGNEILKLSPDQVDVLGDLSWREYNAGNCKQASLLFERWYQLTGNPQALDGMFYCRRKQPQPLMRFAEVSDFSQATPQPKPAISVEPKMTVKQKQIQKKKTSSGTAASKQKKTEIWPKKEIVKNNLYRSGFTFRAKSGDIGQGRLVEFGAPQYYSTFDKWFVRVAPTYSYTGRASSSADVGSSYLRPVIGARAGETKDAFTAVPEVGYATENVNVVLGTTAVGGEESAMPTLNAVFKQNGFSVSVYQSAVRDSLLSISGIKDPYTDASWGRVLKDGMSVHYAFNPAPSYFAEIQASGNYFWGEDVKENTAWDASIIAGKNVNNWTFGLLTSIMSFERDENHFTFGHGGYYSPQTAVQVLPFVAYTTDPSADRWFKADFGMGYLHERLKSTPMYFKTPTAQSGVYRGETHNWMIFQAGVEGRYRLTQNSYLSGSVRGGLSANYYEYNGVVSWTVLF